MSRQVPFVVAPRPARFGVLLAASLLTACATGYRVDPEGLVCASDDPCPDGFHCVKDVCRSEGDCPEGRCPEDVVPDECAGVTCNAAPASGCLGASIHRSYAATGTCIAADAGCAYSLMDVECALGCEDGACRDACVGRTCSTPPAASCVNESTLRVHAATGTCDSNSGACNYAVSDVICAEGCMEGRCLDEGLCAEVSCRSPPVATCSGKTARTYAAVGTCDGASGLCNYETTEQTCSFECRNGACVPPPQTFRQSGPAVPFATRALDQAPGAGVDHALAVGAAGKVARWDGSAWTTLALPSGTAVVNLNAVWLASPTFGLIAGDQGVLLRYDGSALVRETLPSVGTTNLVAVHGEGTRALVAGSDTSYFRCGGLPTCTWTRATINGGTNGVVTLTSARVDETGGTLVERLGGSCALASTRGCLAHAQGGGAFTLTVDGTLTQTTQPFIALGPDTASSSNTALAGRAGSGGVPLVVRHEAAGNSFSATGVPSGLVGGTIRGISSASGDTPGVYILTSRSGAIPGRLRRYTSTGLDELLTLHGSLQALSHNEADGSLISDSTSASTILRRGGAGAPALALGESFAGASLSPTGALVMMSERGDLAFRATSTSAFGFERAPNPTNETMNAVVAGNSMAILVGGGGLLYKWTLAGGFVAPASATTSELRAACRMSDGEFYAVGTGGVRVQFDGVTTRLDTAGVTSTADLSKVTCTGAGPIAVGSESAILLRATDGTWAGVTPALPIADAVLTEVAVHDGALYVAGTAAGVDLYSVLPSGGTTWLQLEPLPAMMGLQVLGPNEAYASSDAVLHRFNGSGWVPLFTASGALKASASSVGRSVFVGADGVVVEAP